MERKDYYQVLGLQPEASAEEIKRAFRRMAMQFHPDRNQGNEGWAHSRFKDINEAFVVLGDPDKKRSYDEARYLEDIGISFDSSFHFSSEEGTSSWFHTGSEWADVHDGDFGDILNKKGFSSFIFRKGFYNPDQTQSKEANSDRNDVHSQHSSDTEVNYEIRLSADEIVQGVEKELVRNGNRLKVSIPSGVKLGSRIKLHNALEITDGRPGDISIIIKLK